MSKSICYLKKEKGQLWINAIYKGEDVWDMVEQKINETSGKDILLNISFPDGTKIDLDGYRNYIEGYITNLSPEKS